MKRIKKISNSIETLHEWHWKCECGKDHGFELRDSPYSHKLESHEVDVTDERQMSSMDLIGVDAVIIGMGNRKMCLGDRVGKKNTKCAKSHEERGY